MLFGTGRSYFLINGASVGVTAAMLSLLRPGDKALLPRNVHRSALSGLILAGARPVWFLPEYESEWGLWGAVTPQTLHEQFQQHPDARLVLITSPTYEGIGSDVAALIPICREYGAALVIDEAHGALRPFAAELPISACQLPCDVVIHSMHKSGGCLTQGALAHLPEGSTMDPSVFQQALNTLQTTSPSYPLMAHIEGSAHFLASPEGSARLARLMRRTQGLRDELEKLTTFRLLPQRAGGDPTRLYLIRPGEPGEDWGFRMETARKIAYESASPAGVLYLANPGLEPDDFQAFIEAFRAEDTLEPPARTTTQELAVRWSAPEMAMLPREAFFTPGERVLPHQAEGRIAKETLVRCPPGIPVLFPGERIRPHHLPLLPEKGIMVVL